MENTTTSTTKPKRQRKPRPAAKPIEITEADLNIPPSEATQEDVDRLQEAFKQLLDKEPPGPTSMERLGFIRMNAEEWEWITYPDATNEDDALKCEIRSNLSFAESDAITYKSTTTYDEVRQDIARYIRNWNLLGKNFETGETQAIPSPRDGGADMLLALDKGELTWLLMAIKYKHREIHTTEEGKKNLKKSGNTGSKSPAILTTEQK